MNYNTLLEFATDLGYELAMSGAETSRIEESVTRVLQSYDIPGEIFAIPNCLTVSIEAPDGTPMTRMRRIGHHSYDLDRVEKYSGLSRAVCHRRPEPEDAMEWLEQVRHTGRTYRLPMVLLGHLLGAAGFCMVYGGCLTDALFAGICGLVVGAINRLMDNLTANPFVRVITASFTMALLAYALGIVGLVHDADAVTIGTLMLLVPGLLFTNAMRDIIFGDTNSGTNRIVQVLLIAAAIAVGTATAWRTVGALWGTPASGNSNDMGLVIECIACLIGCLGFALIYNIHGTGIWLCTIGGMLSWLTFCLIQQTEAQYLVAIFFGTLIASIFAEAMARIRKCPAIIFLVISIFPLLPGAGLYYTMRYAVSGEMELFINKGMHTVAETGIMAVAILLVSTAFRFWSIRQSGKK